MTTDVAKARALEQVIRAYADDPGSLMLPRLPEAREVADTIAALLDEVERLQVERDAYLLSESGRIEERDALARDAARFNWYFGRTGKESVFVGEYMRGIREGWTPDQWRAAIDAAMSEKTP